MKERPILFSGPMVRAILEGRKSQTRRIGKNQGDYPELGVDYIGHLTKGMVAQATYRAFPGQGSARQAIEECLYGIPGDKSWQREPITKEGWYYVRGLLGENVGGDSRPVYVRLHDGEMLWGYSESDDPEAVELDSNITQSNVEWKRVGDRLWVRETWAKETDPFGDPVYFYRADASTYPTPHKWRPSIFMPRDACRLRLEITGVRVERLQDISEADAQREGWDWSNHDLMQSYDPVTMDTARQWFRSLWDKINGKKAPWTSNPWVWVIEFKKVDPAVLQ